MAIDATRRSFGRGNFKLLAKIAFVLPGLAILGFAVAIGGNSRLSSDGISRPAGASQMSNPGTSPTAADAQTGGAATTVAPAAAQRDLDYFPDHYVNQATKIEDPIATF